MLRMKFRLINSSEFSLPPNNDCVWDIRGDFDLLRLKLIAEIIKT